MLRRLHMVAIVAIAIASHANGFETAAVVRKVDAEKRTAVVFAGGQERLLKFSDDAKFLDENGSELGDGIGTHKLNEGAAVTLTVERFSNTPTITTIRIGGKSSPLPQEGRSRQQSVGKSSVGFKPLSEMTADDRYKGEEGGLYGGGRNELPDSLRVVVEEQTAKITPLDSSGNPTADGKIGLVSISMSNATQEFSRFKQIADADPSKSDRVAIVDCAQGGQAMAQWVNPSADPWTEADRRLKSAGVAREQVQVAWVKIANVRPQGELQEHGKQLQKDTEAVLGNMRKHFPNLRIVYLGSRIYGGWADGSLNPEPYAYEGAFVVRWLIQSQLDDEDLAKKPLLLWGPYLWADGITPRQSDKLIWKRSDVVGDGTHPSDSGRQKVAEQLLSFLKTDEHARKWFAKP